MTGHAAVAAAITGAALALTVGYVLALRWIRRHPDQP